MDDIDSEVQSIAMPNVQADNVGQDSEWCEAVVDGQKRRFRFHDYNRIYEVPGLYEEIFYEQLECCSPSTVANLMADLLDEFGDSDDCLRVLDVGAGNGMVGDELRARGAEHLVGVDIIPEARDAAHRDRPGVYDDYRVVDLTDLSEQEEERLRKHSLNSLTSVAALGFGDIPAEAFVKALDLIETPGWVAFTIKEDFLYEHDTTGFARLIRQLCRERVLQMHAYRRYQHRRSVSGEPLYYVAMIARKQLDLPDSLLELNLATANG
jgi:predicted TPR repeat methyltransferase